MGNIILSCGHTADWDYDPLPVLIKSMDRECNKALQISVICEECKTALKKENELFDEEDEAYKWLETDEW